MSVPFLTTEQRVNALAKATAIRQGRAALRKQLADGSCTLEDVFAKSDAGDAVAAGMPIFEVVRALPGYGAVKTGSVLDVCKVSHKRRVRGVGVRQRARLLEELRRRRR